MQHETDATELYQLIHGAAAGGIPYVGGMGNPGMDRGIREELLKQTGKVCGKIKAGRLTEHEAVEFHALCQLASAHGVLSESDLQKVEAIIDRNAPTDEHSRVH